MGYKEKYEEWLQNPFFDEETKKELQEIEGNEEEIKDRFYQDLEFGTAGLRGVIGAGTNRMNCYTVSKATQGLANYILTEGMQNRGVVIAYDSRHMSPEFSECAALCLNANGIKTYIFESLRPVPELSFAVRQLHTIAGIVITASHNPPKYNGYKVYWEDGAQIATPRDKEIMEEAKKVEDYSKVKTMKKEESIEKGLYHVIGKEVDDSYIEELKKHILNPEVIKEQKNLKIVYTPLHGSGNVPVQRILKEIGFENVTVVPEQEKPDGDFPTVDYPNPEDKKAFKLALKLAEKLDADVVLATDPDADRLGVYAKDSETGEYMPFTGNMSGLLIAEYMISQKQQRNEIPENGAIIKTIVSSNLADSIAREYHIHLIEVLTGFKYIGEKMKQFEETGQYQYMFGFEESYGCLIGTYARDKDAVAAVMMLCEAAAYYKKKGLTLWDQMIKIYEKYGFFKEGLLSVTLEGADGAEKIKRMLENLRREPLELLGNSKVIAIRDYEASERKNMLTGDITKINLPKSNVLYYELENDEWCCVRPSGTEPKIKFYMGVKGNSLEDADNKLNILTKAIKDISEK
ncbi:MAG: phospho-sugar mutase [Clostridia bacterium]